MYDLVGVDKEYFFFLFGYTDTDTTTFYSCIVIKSNVLLCFFLWEEAGRKPSFPMNDACRLYQNRLSLLEERVFAERVQRESLLFENEREGCVKLFFINIIEKQMMKKKKNRV